MFEKYARAVNNARERRSLYKLYIAKNVMLGVFFAFTLILLAVIYLFEDRLEDPSDTAALASALSAFAMWLVSIIAAAALWIAFRVKYQRILSRPADAGENTDVVSYRQKTRAEQKSFAKSMWWAIALFAAGIVAMIALIAADCVQNPESDDLGVLSYAGIGVLCACLLVFLFALFAYTYKKQASGKSIEQQTAADAERIDAAQGRKPQYSLAADKNAQTYRYLFPDEGLRAKIEAERKKQTKITLIAAIASCTLAVIIYFTFFCGYVFGWNGSGYLLPVVLAVCAAGTYIPLIPTYLRMRALSDEMKTLLETTPEYSLNLEIWNRYKKFNKFKGKAILIFIAAAFAVSLALAIAMPDKMWSILAVFIILAGLLVNNKFVSDLRKSVLPIERQIDALNAENAAARADETSAEPAARDGE